jgi:hypothetical protein
MLFTLGLAVGVASAATTASQLVDLSRAGLDDDILIALIQTDGSTFQLTAADILALHRQGLSDRVIRAMQATARTPMPMPAQDLSPVAAGEISDRPAPAPPAVVNVYQTVTQSVEAPAAQTFQPYYAIPIAVPVYVGAPVVRTPRAITPTYWGWGGQRRPDSWQPIQGPPPEPAPQIPGRNRIGG